MGHEKGKPFAAKHAADAKPDGAIKAEILNSSQNNELPCAVAFDISNQLQVSPDEVGKTADLLNFKLIKCQLGLFGYQPENRIVKPQQTIKPELKDAILTALEDGRLSCKIAWNIASRLAVSKLDVSCACEGMGIKIKRCQLGGF